MPTRKVVLLCLISALIGAASTYLLMPHETQRASAPMRPNQFGLFSPPPQPPGFPARDEMEDSFFQQFLGNQPSFFFASTSVATREDENFYYFEVPLKENQESKLRANVNGNYLEIEGDIVERSGDETSSAQRMVQKSFSQMLPLPAQADPKSLQIISEPGKTVIRFQKRK